MTSMKVEQGQAPGGKLRVREPGQFAWLAEVTIRNIFVAGQVLVVGAALVGVVLSLCQPSGTRLVGAALCLALVGVAAVLTLRATDAYTLLRHRPIFLLIAACVVGVSAWLAGPHNQQFFFVIVVAIGVLGLATSLGWTVAASAVAAAGMVAPALGETAKLAEFAFVVVVPPVFWIVVDRLARFMLDVGQIFGRNSAMSERPTPTASKGTHGGNSKHVRLLESRAASLHSWESQRPRLVNLLSNRAVSLTTRQLQATFYCADGLEDAEIAAVMGISVRQVRRLLADARERSNSRTREQLAAWALTRNLLP